MADDDFDFFDTPPACETPKLPSICGGGSDNKANGSDHELNPDRSRKSSAASKPGNNSPRGSSSTTSKRCKSAKNSNRRGNDSGSSDSDSFTAGRFYGESPESDSEHGKKAQKIVTHVPSSAHTHSEYSSEYESDSAPESPSALKGVNNTNSKSEKEKSRKHARSSSTEHSGSDTDSISVSDADSDVTDVSPLQTPKHRLNKFEEYSYKDDKKHGKPPKSPAYFGERKLHKTNDNASSDTSDQSGSKLNLNILMQAVQEMEKFRNSESDSAKNERIAKSRRVLFVPQRTASQSKKNFSFSDDRVSTIDRENQRLMEKIMKYTKDAKKGKKKKPQQKSTVPKMTPSAINRLREQQRIERENLALLKRIQRTKATPVVKREVLLNDYEKKTIAGHSVAAAHRCAGDNNYTMTMLNKKSYSMNHLDSEKATVSLRGRGKWGSNMRSNSAMCFNGEDLKEPATVTLHSRSAISRSHIGDGKQLRPQSENSVSVRNTGKYTVMTTKPTVNEGW